jgi:hypothetical protein
MLSNSIHANWARFIIVVLLTSAAIALFFLFVTAAP